MSPITTACNYEQTIGTSWTETNNASMSIDAGIEAAMSAGIMEMKPGS